MEKIRLKEIANIYNGSTPSTKDEDNFDGDIIWITPKDLSTQNKKYISKGERNITNKGLQQINSDLLPKGTILISSRAPIGLISIANRELVTNQGFKNIVVNENIADNEYLYYNFKNRISDLEKLGSGTTFKEISKSSIELFEINLPSLETQQKIAKILSDIDDKIEILHQINDNLTELAKTIYDYWFVQFDFPDENGKPYKTSGGKMVYNEVLKREIPEGWEVKSLGEIETNIITGKTPPTKDENNFNGNILFITIDDIRQNLFIYNSERTLSEKGANTQRAKFLKKGDICVSCIGTVGVIGIVGKIAQTNQQINSISNPQNFNEYFLLNYLDRYFKDNFTAKKGAVLDNMNKAEFESIIIINPIQNIKEIYYGKVKFLYEKIDTNIQQIQYLQSLRDWLLPMLINGQISVE